MLGGILPRHGDICLYIQPLLIDKDLRECVNISVFHVSHPDTASVVSSTLPLLCLRYLSGTHHMHSRRMVDVNPVNYVFSLLLSYYYFMIFSSELVTGLNVATMPVWPVQGVLKHSDGVGMLHHVFKNDLQQGMDITCMISYHRNLLVTQYSTPWNTAME